MRIRMAAMAVTAALVGTLGTPGTAIADVKPSIIDGGTVDGAPWAVAIHYNGSYGCTGTMIAPTWVLTAAVCLGGTTVRVGSAYRSSGGETRTVVAYYMSDYDLGLLQLSSPVDTKYVTLSDDFYTDPTFDSITTMYGWGATTRCNPRCQYSEQLKSASTEVFNIFWYDFSVLDRYQGPAIWSRGVDGTSEYGDTGGPLFFENVQVGVLSYSRSDINFQSHALVSFHRDWIRSITGV